MNIQALTLETAQSILSFLQSSGKLTSEDLEEALKKEPTSEYKRLTDLIHSITCQSEHSEDGGSGCKYYLDSQLSEAWTTYSHQYWLEFTINFLNDLEISSEKEFLQTYQEVKRLFELWNTLSEKAKKLATTLKVFYV